MNRSSELRICPSYLNVCVYAHRCEIGRIVHAWIFMVVYVLGLDTSAETADKLASRDREV